MGVGGGRALVLFARKVRRVSRPASAAIHAAFGTQILLGIATVMSGVAIWLAALHQAVGALLVAATVWGAHEAGAPGRRLDPDADRAERGLERR